MSTNIRKQRQLVFGGKMWVAKDSQKQWLESFGAIVTDKRLTKQDISIKVWVGDYIGEGKLSEIFNSAK